MLKYKDLYDKETIHHVPHVTGVGEHLPIRDGAEDVVLICGVLDHCLDPGAVLKEASRVLVEGGVLLLTLFTFSYIPRFLRHHLLNLVDIHPHHLSKQEIIELSKSTGLSISWQYSKVVTPRRALEVLKTSALLSAVKYLGAALIEMEDLRLILTKRQVARIVT